MQPQAVHEAAFLDTHLGTALGHDLGDSPASHIGHHHVQAVLVQEGCEQGQHMPMALLPHDHGFPHHKDLQQIKFTYQRSHFRLAQLLQRGLLPDMAFPSHFPTIR